MLKRGVSLEAPRDVSVYALGSLLSLNGHRSLFENVDIASAVVRIIRTKSTRPDDLHWTLIRQALGGPFRSPMDDH